MKISLRSYYINKVGVDNISYDFFDILYNNKISYGKIISDKSHKINLMYQKGGSIHNADLNGITYQYHTSKIELIGNNHKKMDFLSIDGINNYCATLIYDKPEYGSTMVLNGIFNGEDCIKCMKSGIEYKVGDILMQIIINLVKEKPNFAHIKTIELKDNSIIKNGDIGIELIYLRTITHGIPYYAKYGFVPKINILNKENKDNNNKIINDDNDVFEYNKYIFSKSPFLTINQINELIQNLTNNEQTIFNDMFTYKLNKVSQITASKFLSIIMDKYNLLKKTLKTYESYQNSNVKELKNEYNTINNKLFLLANIIIKIYKKIYILCGYAEYYNKKWILYIR